MEFHVVRSELASELQLMMGVIEKKNTMPILANVLIKAENNQLILQATDLEVGIISQCPAQVVEHGEFTVNAKQLQEMLQTLSDQQVSFSLNEGTMLDLVCGTAQFSIETMSTQDFPTIPEYDFADSMNLPIKLFSECIQKILFSVSNDPHKYALNGAFFKLEEGELTMVSTDGHRMSVVKKTLGEGFSDVAIIIPRKTMIEVKKSLQAEQGDEHFQVGFAENRIFFKMGPRVLFSRLVDGRFPDYNKALPKDNDKRFEFDRKLFQNVVRRKAVLATDKSKLVRLTFSSGMMMVVLKNPERGESVDKVGIDYEGPKIDVGFNVDYILDFLKNMSTEKICVKLKDDASQGLFEIVEDEVQVDYQHVIMPMRLTG